MPHRPARRCTCGRRATETPCPACRAEQLDRLRQTHPDAGQRGYTWTWRRLAAEAINAHPWCERCGSTYDLTGDHRDPTKRTDLTIHDIAVLCRSCNTRKGGPRRHRR